MRKPPKKTVSLQTLLTGQLMIFTVMVALGMGLSGSQQFRRQLEKDTVEQLQEAALRVKNGIEGHLTHHAAAVSTLADRLGSEQPANWQRELSLSLESTIRHNEGFLTMLVTDANGQIVQTIKRGQASLAPDPNAMPQVDDRPYFSEPKRTGRNFISGIFRGQDLGNDAIVAISAPIMDAKGHFVGVVEGSIDIRKLPLRSLGTHHPLLLVAYDKADQVIYSSSPQKYPALSRWKRKNWSARENFFEYEDEEQEERVAVLMDLEAADWTVAASVERRHLEEELSQFCWMMAATLGVFSLASSWAARHLAKKIAGPIEEIAGRLTNWRSNDHRLNLEAESLLMQETKEIALAIESFARRLEESAIHLRQALDERDEKNSALALLTRELDAKVAKRTAQLAESEARYRQVVEKSGDIIYRTNRKGIIEYHNPAFENYFGYQAIGKNVGDLMDAKVYRRLRRRVVEQIRCGVETTFLILEVFNQHGQRRWIGQSTQILRDEEDTLTGYQCIARDVTEQYLAEEALKTAEERYALAVRGSNQGIWDWNCQTGEVYYSDRWKDMLGIHHEEVLNQLEDWLGRVHPMDRAGLHSCLESFVVDQQTNNFEYEHRIKHSDGTWKWVLASGAAVRDESGQALRVAGSSSDQTGSKLLDPLTGLENRLSMIERLDQLIESQQAGEGHRFAVLLLDLDQFKLINDGMGHLMGDQLLLAVARRLESAIASTIKGRAALARVGGDEFLILLEELHSSLEAVRLADSIQIGLEPHFDLGSSHVFASCSIGIAISSEDLRNSEEILQRADTAMYSAKTEGRGRYCLFDRQMLDRARTRLELESNLREGIDRNEFCLHYQPQVELSTGELSGFEALLRWQHPTRGLVPPGEFIPLAEETGLILSLGRWAIKSALQQLAAWGDRYTISVNLSAKQFIDPELPGFVEAELRQTKVTPQRLHLEITESMVAEDPKLAQTVLKQLQALGVGLEIDDFGTGYSSLSQLHRLPFNTLKIDRSFVQDMDREGDHIVDSILRLASSLNIDVVAEGIETKQQWRKLAAIGCRYGQGYLFSRPLSSEDAGRLVREVSPWGRPDWMEIGRDLCELHLGVSGCPTGHIGNASIRSHGYDLPPMTPPVIASVVLHTE